VFTGQAASPREALVELFSLKPLSNPMLLHAGVPKILPKITWMVRVVKVLTRTLGSGAEATATRRECATAWAIFHSADSIDWRVTRGCAVAAGKRVCLRAPPVPLVNKCATNVNRGAPRERVTPADATAQVGPRAGVGIRASGSSHVAPRHSNDRCAPEVQDLARPLQHRSPHLTNNTPRFMADAPRVINLVQSTLID
jgi:hypothetical protein